MRLLILVSCLMWAGTDAQGTYCLRPPVLQNELGISPPGGDLSASRYSTGTSVTFACAQGYRITGTATVTCGNRAWLIPPNGAIPRCERIITGVVPTVGDACRGRCTSNALCRVVDNQPRCICPQGYVQVGTSCTPVSGANQCPGGCPLNAICRPFQGQTRCICAPTFFEELGRCQPRSLLTPRPGACEGRCPDNAGCYLYNNQFRCVCSPGYLVYNGRSCLPRPQTVIITTAAPVVRCARPPESQNRITIPNNNRQSWGVNDVIRYACSGNYVVQGRRMARCLATGQFMFPPPICIALETPRTTIPTTTTAVVVPVVRCTAPIAPFNGFIEPIGQTIFLVGQPVRYNCNPLYRLVGQSLATCLASGQFSPANPQCIREPTPSPVGPVVGCIIPIAPTNGAISPVGQEIWSPGDSVTYSCNPGFSLIGVAIARCLNTGFSSSPPFCRPGIVCPQPVVPFGGSINDPGRLNWVPGDIVTYSCRPGFTLFGGPTITCRNDGTYSGAFPSCGSVQEMVTAGPVICTAPSAPGNGFSLPRGTTVWTPNQSVTFGCNQGYLLVGDASARCQSDGTFTDSTTFCILPQVTPSPTVCLRPDIPDNARVASNSRLDNLQVGQSIVFECIVPYVAIGSLTIVCQADGSFSISPVCVPPQPRTTVIPTVIVTTIPPVFCSRPQAPANGEILGDVNRQSWPVGDRVLFNCNAGYNLVGSETITCLGNGFYNGIVPQCLAVAPAPVTCPNPVPPTFGSITNPQNSYNFNDVVVFACNFGFQISGSSESRCLDTGVFSNPVPQCVAVVAAVTCTVTAPEDGSIVGGRTTVAAGEAVEFACNEPLRLNGESTIICGVNGALEAEPPVCTVCIPPAPENGLVLPAERRRWLANDLISWGCDEGFSISGIPTGLCQEGGAIGGFLPTCEEGLFEQETCTPPRPENGFVFAIDLENPDAAEAVDPGSEITVAIGRLFGYGCQEGFNLVGGIDRGICIAGGALAIAAPRCL